MPSLVPVLAFTVPGWLREPSWWRPLTHALRVFLMDHQAGGLFLVVFLEELGVPLPAPGDVAIAYGGYLTTTGAVPYPMAYLAVVAGAVLGSTCNMTLSRRYGRPFLLRYGRYVGITPERMARAERIFGRWGPWAIIIGRHIPGMRIVLSALSGILEVPYKVFIPCVLISASIWAAIFLELGRRLGPRVRELFLLLPVQLVPWVLLGLAVIVIGYVGYEHGYKSKGNREPVQQPH
jgi:membrane-associated protein